MYEQKLIKTNKIKRKGCVKSMCVCVQEVVERSSRKRQPGLAGFCNGLEAEPGWVMGRPV